MTRIILSSFLLAGAAFAVACGGRGSAGEDPATGRAAVATLEALAASTTSAPEEVEASTTEATADPIVVGTLMDEENILAPLDRQPGVAFIGAVERLNDAGGLLGRPIEVLRETTDSRLSTADKAAGRLAAAGVDLLVVTCELDFAAPAIQRMEATGTLVVSPCGGEPEWGSGEASALGFSMVAPPEVYGRQLADLLWSEGIRSAGILWESPNPEARAECGGFADQWSEIGGTVAVEVPVATLKAADLLADRNDVLESLEDAEVVFVCAFQRLGTRALSTLRAEGVLTPFFGGLTMDNPTFRPVDVEGIGEYRMASFASVSGDDPWPGVALAADAYRSVDGIAPSSGRFVLGVDLATVWATAVEATGTTDGATLARAIMDSPGIEGASGTIEFGGSQAAIGRQLRIMRHTQGRMVFEQLWPGEPASS